jgi:flagellar biosynthesis protein FliP
VTLHSALVALGAFAVTLGLLALTLRLLGRLHGGGLVERRGFTLKVLSRVPTGPRQAIALLQVGERVLVVSLADSGARLLAELDDADRDVALRAPVPSRAKLGLALSIPGLGRVALMLALLVLPLSARAQAGSPAPGSRAPAASTAPAGRSKVVPIVTGAPAPAPARATVGGAAGIAVPAFGVLPPAPPKVDVRIGEGKDAVHLEGAVGLVVFLGVLTLLPAMFLLMTSFTRILIVLHFLRSALGTQTAPPNQLLVAIAVLLTGVVMNPVLQQTQKTALQPYLEGRLSQTQAYQLGIVPFREFMLANTRTQDLNTFAEMSGVAGADSVEQLPTVTVISAFVISELRTAFQMGFVIYLPFVVVDLIVASVLMSLGMFMLPPVMISLPFKLLLFVLADGWTLVVQNLVASFR